MPHVLVMAAHLPLGGVDEGALGGAVHREAVVRARVVPNLDVSGPALPRRNRAPHCHEVRILQEWVVRRALRMVKERSKGRRLSGSSPRVQVRALTERGSGPDEVMAGDRQRGAMGAIAHKVFVTVIRKPSV